MSKIPANLKYTTSHEWLRLEADGRLSIGISDHAQELLGDLVFVELPPVGKRFAAGEEAAVVESVKAAADVYAPVGGEVVEINQALVGEPEKINQDPYEHWLFRLNPDAETRMDDLLDAEAYKKHLGE